ncbi:MAG: acyl-CoA dehydrogenase family protein [Acidimicrobiia bacterium]|nr:acyl-CoA dehydrogenase family protein [Acidimicrobiia bacterium]
MRWRVEDTPEQAEFRAGFREWLRGALSDAWVDAVEAGDDAAYARAREEAEAAGWNPFSWTATLGESGYAAPLWPKEYGGLSAPSWAQRVVREELERYRLPTVSANILGLGLAGPTIIEHGTEAQKGRYLRKILTGEEIWCQLFSEPGAGSDLASLGTRAVRDGDEWVVNGQKVWTSIAQLSKFGMLVARTDADKPKHEGLTYLIVDMKAPGVEVRPLYQITGSAEFNEVYFTDVRVPDENRIGDVGDGWRVARTTLMNERVTLSGVSLDNVAFTGGVRRDPWESFLESVPDRRDPVVRQELAQYYIEQQVKEITSYRAAAARAAGQQPGPEGAIGKVFNAEYNQRRSAFAVDRLGPRGMAWVDGDRTAENKAHAFLRARANSIEGGTSEILRNQIGERVLGLPREPEADKGVAWKEIKRG